MLAAWTMLAASVLVLSGWALQQPDLARLMAGATVMKASSAITFFAAGVALLACASRASGVGCGLPNLLVVLMGGASAL